MLVDWFTVGAQALNFIVLVWLLKRFLYQPILNAIDAREQHVARQLGDAASKESEAQQQREEYRRKNEEFERRRAELLGEAIAEAKTERHRLLDEARKAAEDLSARRLDALRSDARNLNAAISRRAQQEVFAIARKALTDLAGSDLEQQMVQVFIRRLRGLQGEMKEDLGSVIRAEGKAAIVRSAFTLPLAQQAAVQKAVNEVFAADIGLQFETAPEVVSGIELATDGHKVSWNIGGYLASLERGVDQLLKDGDKIPARPESTSQ